MKISVDTKEDSHDDIRKVIRMLQNLVGDNQEIFTNQPEAAQEMASPMANIFGDSSSASETPTGSEAVQETQQEATQEAAEETSRSTEDLFAELFNEEELKKMDASNVKNDDDKEDDEAVAKTKDKKHIMEFY